MTPAATATVFVPASLNTANSTLSRPPVRVITSLSFPPFMTVPTSFSLMAASPFSPTTILPISSMSTNWFRMRTKYSASASFSEPLVRLIFSSLKRSMTWDKGRPRRVSLDSSISTCTSSSMPPLTCMDATPSRLSRRRLISSSASSRNPARSSLPCRLIRMMGAREGSKRSSSGFSASRGRPTESSFSLISIPAKSMAVPQLNSRITSESPALDTEPTRTTPATIPTASSMGLVIRFSTSPGAAPGYSVLIVMVGKVISGSRSMPSRLKEIRPKITTAAVSMTTVTGLRMDLPTIFIPLSVPRPETLQPQKREEVCPVLRFSLPVLSALSPIPLLKAQIYLKAPFQSLPLSL
ncbi:hypothetical protein ES703_68435 [subsurface metagenome]